MPDRIGLDLLKPAYAKDGPEETGKRKQKRWYLSGSPIQALIDGTSGFVPEGRTRPMPASVLLDAMERKKKERQKAEKAEKKAKRTVKLKHLVGSVVLGACFAGTVALIGFESYVQLTHPYYWEDYSALVGLHAEKIDQAINRYMTAVQEVDQDEIERITGNMYASWSYMQADDDFRIQDWEIESISPADDSIRAEILVNGDTEWTAYLVTSGRTDTPYYVEKVTGDNAPRKVRMMPVPVPSRSR